MESFEAVELADALQAMGREGRATGKGVREGLSGGIGEEAGGDGKGKLFQRSTFNAELSTSKAERREKDEGGR